MLQCVDESIYTGHTDDLDRRIAEHVSGAAPGYTSTRLPVQLIWSQEFSSREEALGTELQIKNWSRNKKLALAAGDWDALSRLARGPNRSRRPSTPLRYARDERR
jgi:predicted GIY-YIG superfamily endonuclease